MDEFTGWPSDGPMLLGEIAEDNRAECWDDRHEKAIRAPMIALAAALEAEFGPVRVFKSWVNRRFRPSAPPLRVDTGGVVRSPGGCSRAVVLSATALTVSAGHWRFDGGQVRRYRAAVAGDHGGPPAPDDGAGSSAAGGPVPMARRGPAPGQGSRDAGGELGAILEELAGAGLLPDTTGQLRGLPRGWRADHPRIGLVGRRGLQVVRSWEVGPWLATPEPLRHVREAWAAAGPLVAWLDTHVGPPDPRPARPRPEAEQARAEPDAVTTRAEAEP